MKIMKTGYAGVIDNEFVFVIANSKADAIQKFQKLANGKVWEFDSTRNYKLIE